MKEINAIITISYRDFTKFLRDRARIIATFVFPFIFIGVLGKSLAANLGAGAGYDFMLFTFTGVIAQTLFQSSAAGVISLVEDRENDFSQELFVAPVSRYSIIIGKILGESLVALAQVVGIVLFGLILGVHLSFFSLIKLAPVAVLICFMGGAFGIFVLSNLKSQRSANQIFPYIIFPQFFLAGVFNPVKDLPIYLLVLSRLAPMTYAVDLIRSVYYEGMSSYSKVVLFNLPFNLMVVGGMFVVFILLGTYFFMKNERNR